MLNLNPLMPKDLLDQKHIIFLKSTLLWSKNLQTIYRGVVYRVLVNNPPSNIFYILLPWQDENVKFWQKYFIPAVHFKLLQNTIFIKSKEQILQRNFSILLVSSIKSIIKEWNCTIWYFLKWYQQVVCPSFGHPNHCKSYC